MRTAVILLLLGFVALSQQDHHEEFRANFDGCTKEIGVKEEDVKKFFTDGSTTDKNVKCFLKCMEQKIGGMNAAGAFDKEAMKSHIPSSADKAKAEAAIDKCINVKTPNDPCEAAYEFSTCIHQEIGPMHGPLKP